MLKPNGRAQALISALVVALLVVGGVLVYVRTSTRDTRSLCAQLPDSAGLYPGNAVNVRGVKIGAVTQVTPSPGHVTVQMRIDDRSLADGVRVLAVNNSVLADRRIELVDAVPRGGAELPAGQCVPLSRGFTPVSVSTAFQSFTTMFDELGGPGADSDAPIAQALSEASRQVDGSGEDLNKILKNMAGIMADPNEFLSQMRTVFKNLAVLTEVADDNWDAIKDIGTNAADLTHLMGSLFKSFVYIFDGLGEAGPGMDDLLSNVAPPMLEISDELMPFIDVGLARVDDLTAILTGLPGIGKGLEASLNRKAGAFRISVRTPTVVAGTPDGGALCTLMNATERSSCDVRSRSTVAVDLGALITRAVQGGIGR